MVSLAAGDIRKLVWDVTIPEYNPDDEVHTTIRDTAMRSETKAKELLPELLEQYNPLTVLSWIRHRQREKMGPIRFKLPELCIETLEEAQPKQSTSPRCRNQSYAMTGLVRRFYRWNVRVFTEPEVEEYIDRVKDVSRLRGEIVRYDHNRDAEGGHDIEEEGLHRDVYREGAKVRTKRVSGPIPADKGFDSAEEDLNENAEQYIKRFEQWHGIKDKTDL